MIINIDTQITKIIVLSRNKNKFYINEETFYDKGFENLFDNIDKSFNLNKTEEYIVELVDMIRVFNYKINKIYFNIQDNNIIIRNIENIKLHKRNEITELIKYEINKYIPINFDEYLIKYKKISGSNGNKIVQAILFPRKYIEVCKKISEKLKISNKYLYINFDILQKIVNLELTNFSCEKNKKSVIIENKEKDIIINEVLGTQIIETHILEKNNKYIANKLSNYSSIYYFGIEDNFIKKFKIEKLDMKNKYVLYNKDKFTSKDIMLNYLTQWAMVI